MPNTLWRNKAKDLAFSQSTPEEIEHVRQHGGQLHFLYGCPLCDNKVPHKHTICHDCLAVDWSGKNCWTCEQMREAVERHDRIEDWLHRNRASLARVGISIVVLLMMLCVTSSPR
ncbi:MAG: hypothetical protein M0R06_13320 [Sphaerochaeta sp.]|nr:hypothetical protein [Sphaerochaeta sp.]